MVNAAYLDLRDIFASSSSLNFVISDSAAITSLA